MRNLLLTSVATVLVPGVAVALVPYWILQATGGVTPPTVGFLEIGAILLALIGAGMVVWVSIVFVTQGKGTPIPIEPPETFVTAGLYRFVRNPMYFGALLALFAEAIFFRSAWIVLYAGMLWLALHTFSVYLEETELERRFGETYREYRARTPRWIPRWPKS